MWLLFEFYRMQIFYIFRQRSQTNGKSSNVLQFPVYDDQCSFCVFYWGHMKNIVTYLRTKCRMYEVEGLQILFKPATHKTDYSASLLLPHQVQSVHVLCYVYPSSIHIMQHIYSSTGESFNINNKKGLCNIRNKSCLMRQGSDASLPFHICLGI